MSKNQERQKISKARQAQRQQLTVMGVVSVVIILFFVIFLAVLNRASDTAVPIGKYGTLYQTMTNAGAPILGDPTAGFTIAEFADFGCPFCLDYQPTVTQIIDQYVRTGQIRFVFETQMNHPNSNVAAQAALCAARQHRFWEMHDALYEIQAQQGTDGFTSDKLRHTAESLGMDGSALFDCIGSGGTMAQVNAAIEQYNQVHAGGTPTLMWSSDGVTWQFFLGDNLQPYTQGGVPLAVIARTIDNYYQTSQTLTPTGH